jgi:DNA-directed RNA polymerase specialized sigma24 family protein
MLSNQEFRDLRKRHLAGDLSATQAIGADLLERARRICWPKWRGLQRCDKEDQVQDVVTEAFRSLPGWNPTARIGPWFRALALYGKRSALAL